MITEDYCSYEISRLLEEKGFHAPDLHGLDSSQGHLWVKVTHQMAMKWLREVHKISVEVYVCYDKKKDGKIWAYIICNIYDADKSLAPAFQYHSTYEEAVEAALKYCLTNLI